MKSTQTHASRRTVLRGIGAAALGVSLSGCADVLSSDDGRDGDVVLDPPENYEGRKDLDLPYPMYSEEIPSASVPAPLQDRTVRTTEFVGERHAMLTFIYTSCKTVCPGLTAALRHVQADSIEDDYAEDFAFMPTTFDPKYDTAERLRSYGEDMGVNFEAENWYFLRPKSPADARSVVEETYGVAFEQGQSDDGMGTDDGKHSGHGRMFNHMSLILLVNEGGFVERAYNGRPPGPSTAIDDARTLVERW